MSAMTVPAAEGDHGGGFVVSLGDVGLEVVINFEGILTQFSLRLDQLALENQLNRVRRRDCKGWWRKVKRREWCRKCE